VRLEGDEKEKETTLTDRYMDLAEKGGQRVSQGLKMKKAQGGKIQPKPMGKEGQKIGVCPKGI